MNMQRIDIYSFKNKVTALLSLFFILFFSSCEEVVNLDLETGEPKIVIDAEIIWQKGTLGNEQIIKISKTAPYYNNITPKVSGAQVKIESSNGAIFTFNETIGNEGSSDVWRYGEDYSNYYFNLSTFENDVLFFPKKNINNCPGFNPEDITTWCKVKVPKY